MVGHSVTLHPGSLAAARPGTEQPHPDHDQRVLWKIEAIRLDVGRGRITTRGHGAKCDRVDAAGFDLRVLLYAGAPNWGRLATTITLITPP